MLIEKSLNLPVGSLKIIKFSSDISNFSGIFGWLFGVWVVNLPGKDVT